MQISDYIRKQYLVMDGAMGTYYCSLINRPGAVSEHANLSQPEMIKAIHTEYLDAGARIIRTNTFAANKSVLQCDEKVQVKLVKAACTLAKQAAAERHERQQQEPVWIFGDIGPIPENAQAQESEVLGEYKLLCDQFIEEDLDGIHFETFSDPYYIEKLIPYIKQKKKMMFILASFSVNKNGYTASGISAVRILEKVYRLDGVDACGFNCGVGSGHMLHLLEKTDIPDGKFFYVSPNAGYPEQLHNRMVFMDNARYFADNMEKIADLGADLIGGCCGTTPEYIASLTRRLTGKHRSIPVRKKRLRSEEVKRPVRENEFYQKLKQGKKVLAVELDPPYDANIDQIMECAHQIKRCGADVITFADSPMGRSRVDSILMGIKIAGEAKLPVMPHICCRDRNMISMRSVLLGAYIHGIRNLLLVTGDPVPGESRTSTTGVFDYNSIKLMEFVREMNVEHFAEEPIFYGGALNHGRGQLDRIIERMRRKISAGASYFLTQPIYSKEDVMKLQAIKQQVDTKILCGIMPLVSYRNACFIKNEMGQINVPEEVIARYHPDMSREEAENVGAQIAREMLALLEPVADGYYFMLPFNRVSLMDKILK